MRGRRSNGHGGGNNGHHGGNNGGGQGQRRVNPRVQTFDSNGPDVRIRGNAFQITEKYMTLARDASSAGDRILAESYFQHAEHYQRMINEMNEEYARQNPGYNPNQNYEAGSPGMGPQPGLEQPAANAHLQPQPSVDGMSDLDQGFLVGPRSSAVAQNEQTRESSSHQNNFSRSKETEVI
jgi:hypothetical protein